MIVSKIFEIPKTELNYKIEQNLRKTGIDPIRWAIIDVREYSYKIIVSFKINFRE